MKARMELAKRKPAEAMEAALALSEEGAGDASNKEGEGERRQIGGEKRGRNTIRNYQPSLYNLCDSLCGGCNVWPIPCTRVLHVSSKRHQQQIALTQEVCYNRNLLAPPR